MQLPGGRFQYAWRRRLSRRQLRSKYRLDVQMRCSGHVSSRRVHGVVARYSCRQPELRLVAGVQGICN
jgi:hypothetical protein